jgi:hypothetical protein
VVILGDAAARMNAGDRLQRQASLVRVLAMSALSGKSAVCIGVWNAHVRWVGNVRSGQPKWRRGSSGAGEDLDALWRVQAEGGNNMELALRETLQHMGDATDVIMFCHGHASPFEMPLSGSGITVMGNDIDWRSYYLKHLVARRVHFIGVGVGCDRLSLERMADIAGGRFIYLPTSQ